MATSTNYMPPQDAAFETWQVNLVTVIGADPTRFGLTDADMNRIRQDSGTWHDAYNAETAARDAYHSAVGYKKNARKVYETLLREIIRGIEANPGVPAEAKREAGIPVHDTSPSPVPPPTVAPLAVCDASKRLAHSVSFRPVGSKTRGKPAGVKQTEVWSKKGGAAPLDETECELIGTPSRSPFKIKYTGADAGKIIHYMLRYVSTRGVPGPWSETISATVQG